MHRVPDPMIWLPTMIGSIGMTATYVVHRRNAVGLAGWLAPLAAALMSAVILVVASGALGWEATVPKISPENLVRLVSRSIHDAAELLLGGLFGAGAAALLGVWFVKRPEPGAWRLRQVIAAVGLWVLIAEVVVRLGDIYPWITRTHLIAVLILGCGHIAIERIRGTRSHDDGRVVLVLTTAALGAWFTVSVVADIAVWEWRWYAWATPESRYRLLTGRVADLEIFEHLPHAVAVCVGALAALARRARSSWSLPARRTRRLLFAMAALVAAPHLVLLDQYRAAASFVRTEAGYESHPLRSVGDLELATSSDGRGYWDSVMVVVGRQTIRVAPQPDLRPRSRDLTDWDALSGTIAEEVERAKSEYTGWGSPPNVHEATLAFDRCTTYSVVADTIEQSRRAGLKRLRFMVERTPESAGVVDFQSSRIGPRKRVTLVVDDRGVDILQYGTPLAAIPGCDPDGPTVCVGPGTGPCGGPDYDWKAVHAELLSLSSPNHESTVGVEVGPSVCWQSVVDALDATRWRHPETSRVEDNRLFHRQVVTPVARMKLDECHGTQTLCWHR